jgi:hypothetical protein
MGVRRPRLHAPRHSLGRRFVWPGAATWRPRAFVKPLPGPTMRLTGYAMIPAWEIEPRGTDARLVMGKIGFRPKVAIRESKEQGESMGSAAVGNLTGVATALLVGGRPYVGEARVTQHGVLGDRLRRCT